MRAHQVLAVFVLLCSLHCFGADDSFFQHYVRLVVTNVTTPLVDTNNTSPKLKDIVSPLDRLRAAGEVGGVRLGMTMDEVVQRWGKPRNLYANCGPGARFNYVDATRA